jgi:hypothetical protein
MATICRRDLFVYSRRRNYETLPDAACSIRIISHYGTFRRFRRPVCIFAVPSPCYLFSCIGCAMHSEGLMLSTEVRIGEVGATAAGGSYGVAFRIEGCAK